MRVVIAVVIVFFLSPVRVGAVPEIDIDGDGLAEIVAISSSAKVLNWEFSNPTSQLVTSQAQFGSSEERAFPGAWSVASTSAIVTASFSGEARGVWNRMTLEGSESVDFGADGSKYVVGPDFDGNGLSDIVSIRKNGQTSFALNPFAGAEYQVVGDFKLAKKRVKRGVLLPLTRSDGSTVLGVLEKRRLSGLPRYSLVTLDVAGQQTDKRLIAYARPIIEAHAIRSRKGYDDILLVSNNNFLLDSPSKRSVTILDQTGSFVYRKYFSPKSVRGVLVGDYHSAEGQEFILVGKKRKGLLISPYSNIEQEIILPKGTLLDAVQVVGATKVKAPSHDNSSGTAKTPEPQIDEEAPVGAGLNKVCKSTRKFTAGALFKPEADAADSRFGKPVVLLQGSFKTGTGSLNIYASNGAKVCEFTFKGSANTSINGGAHHYYSGWSGGCARRGSEIAALAKRSSGNSNVYVQWKNGSCLGPVSPTARSGGLY